ncbi:MAG: PHB depolymerase family esterase [Burkholderiaceae bacterium]
MKAMQNATQLVRTRGPMAATRFIQGLLRPQRTQPRRAPHDIDASVVVVDPVRKAESSTPPLQPWVLPSASGQFLEQRYSGHSGARNFKLYVPSEDAGTALPLVVMLHGCTQDPDDFATGTRANRWAEDKHCLVVYPEQIQRANSHRCWNWFRPLDQQAGLGEPAIIAGIVRQVIGEYRVDTQRIYVTGLSAGGAMAATMAREYPELFAAVGVHSGLPARAAHDVASAFVVMKSGQPAFASAVGAIAAVGRAVPLIALHGDADQTVNPANSDRLVQNAVETHRLLSPDSPLQMSEQTIHATASSHAVHRTRYVTSTGVSMVERWVIRGAGHAWSGGDSAGSFADARGPDATAVMLDFFEQHVAPADSETSAVMDSTAPV